MSAGDRLTEAREALATLIRLIPTIDPYEGEGSCPPCRYCYEHDWRPHRATCSWARDEAERACAESTLTATIAEVDRLAAALAALRIEHEAHKILLDCTRRDRDEARAALRATVGVAPTPARVVLHQPCGYTSLSATVVHESMRRGMPSIDEARAAASGCGAPFVQSYDAETGSVVNYERQPELAEPKRAQRRAKDKR